LCFFFKPGSSSPIGRSGFLTYSFADTDTAATSENPPIPLRLGQRRWRRKTHPALPVLRSDTGLPVKVMGARIRSGCPRRFARVRFGEETTGRTPARSSSGPRCLRIGGLSRDREPALAMSATRARYIDRATKKWPLSLYVMTSATCYHASRSTLKCDIQRLVRTGSRHRGLSRRGLYCLPGLCPIRSLDKPS
jgi:hypothetical protein